MEKEKAPVVRTTIELPAELNRKLLRDCRTAKRSRHSEMLYRLEKSFETAASGGIKEKNK